MARKISEQEIIGLVLEAIMAETGLAPEQLIKELGMDPKELVSKVFVPCSIPERKKRRIQELRKILRNKENMSKEVSDILKEIAGSPLLRKSGASKRSSAPEGLGSDRQRHVSNICDPAQAHDRVHEADGRAVLESA